MNPLVAGTAGLTFAYIEYGKMPEGIFLLLVAVSSLLFIIGIAKSEKS